MHLPKDIAYNFIEIGINKTKLPPVKQFCLGIFAGIFIAFAGMSTVIASASIENPSVARLVMALIFPGGLSMILLAGSELFTGNNLIIIPVLEKKVRVSAMLRNWVMVYLGNLTGSILTSCLLVYSHLPSMMDNLVADQLVMLAEGKLSLSFMDAFLRGIGCNILVCIAVWIAYAATTAPGKIISLYLPIVTFVLCGFEHCVADMFYIPAGILTSARYNITAEGLTICRFLTANLVPVTLGNLIGGCFVVGFGYWFIYLRED